MSNVKQFDTATITNELLALVNHSEILTTSDFESLYLDVQSHDDFEHDENHTEETVILTKCIIDALIARRRSIEYARKNKQAKDVQTKQAKYNSWASSNPVQALDPRKNLEMQRIYGVISVEQYNNLKLTLDELTAKSA